MFKLIKSSSQGGTWDAVKEHSTKKMVKKFTIQAWVFLLLRWLRWCPAKKRIYSIFMRKLLAWWAASFLKLHAHNSSSCTGCSDSLQVILLTCGRMTSCHGREEDTVGRYPTEESWCFVTGSSPALSLENGLSFTVQTAAPPLLTLPYLARGTKSNWSSDMTCKPPVRPCYSRLWIQLLTGMK